MKNLLLFSFFVVISGCQLGASSTEPNVNSLDPQDTSELRPLSREEGLADLEQLISMVRNFYGPLEFKEDRFEFKFSELADGARRDMELASTEPERLAVLARLLAHFDDGHVSINFQQTSDQIAEHYIPLKVTAVEGAYLVEKVGPELAEMGIQRGDKVLSLDEKEIDKLMAIVYKYKGLGNKVSNRHLVSWLFSRDFYIPELVPNKKTVKVMFENARGQQFSRSLLWRQKTAGAVPVAPAPQGVFNNVSKSFAKIDRQAGMEHFGKDLPFFVNETTKAALGLRQVQPSKEYQEKYELSEIPPVYSALYNYKGKNLLLIRQPQYHTDVNAWLPRLKYYMALLDQYQPLVDGLVIDQTNNPGGSTDYLHNFFKIFVQGQARNFTNFFNADKKWALFFDSLARQADPSMESERSRYYLNAANAVSTAMDEGRTFSSPVTFDGTDFVYPHAQMSWKKPVLVLINELSGSCGDLFPMMMKENGIAPLYGERTLGLGGNVEDVPILHNSRAMVALTRGLFTMYQETGEYLTEDLVENNGVLPDIHSPISVDDFRSHYLGYTKGFSDAIVEQIENTSRR